MNNYTSSIINKYGDNDNVKHDAKTLNEILQRQGSSLLIDCIAEHAGDNAVKFKMHSSDRCMIIISLVDELENALKERM